MAAVMNSPLDGLRAPAPLRDLKSWVMWRFEYEPDKPKPRKMPYYANGTRRRGKQGTPSDRKNLTTFDEALAAAKARGMDGVGLALMPEHDITALDFDHCVTPSGVDPRVLDLVVGTYAELSPSGNGVRAFVKGKLADRKSNADDWPFGFETFTDKGFVTLTGNALDITEMTDSLDEIAPVSEGVTQLYHARFDAANDHTSGGSGEPMGLTDQEISQCLLGISPDLSHDDWLSVGMALHHETQGEGFAFWDAWSAQGATYPGADVLEHRWDSFVNDGGNPVTARTLLHLAGDAGREVRDRYSTARPEEFADLGDEPPLESAVGADPGRFAVLPIVALMRRERPEYIVKPVLPRAGFAIVYGPPASGKSFVILDLTMAIARGVPWRGHRVQQGRVVYIAAEGAGGFRNRVEAYMLANELDDVPDFLTITDAPNLMERKDIKDLIASIGKADVIVVDTLAQTTPGANENAGEDMGRMLAHCAALHRASGAIVLLVHHSGKDSGKGARGWSGLRGAADAEFEVVREGNARALRVTKMKDGDDTGTFGFQLQNVLLGQDADGDDITSCVVVEAAFEVVKEGREKLGLWGEFVVGSLEKRSELTCLDIQQWAHEENPDAKRETVYRGIRRAINQLVEKGEVVERGDFYALAGLESGE